MSSLGADARYKRPLHTTSQPVDVANGTDVPEVANTRTVIQSFDTLRWGTATLMTRGQGSSTGIPQKMGIEEQRDFKARQALSGDTELTAGAANVLNSPISFIVSKSTYTKKTTEIP